MSSSMPLNASFLMMDVFRRLCPPSPLSFSGVLLDVFGLVFYLLEPLLLLEPVLVGVVEESLPRFFVVTEGRVGVVFFVDRDERAGGDFSAFSSGVEGALTLLEGSFRAKNR